jgi:hypothetical protein
MVEVNDINAIYLRHYIEIGFAIMLAGFLGSMLLVRSLKVRLLCGAGLTILPPLSIAGLYYMGKSSGCSGGDCTGVMIVIGMLMLIATIPTLFGLGIFLGGIAGGAGRLIGKALTID